MINEMTTVLEPSPLADFVETRYVKDLTNRALCYIQAGFPVHLRGPSGTGKTTLAMHLAGRIGRPVVLIHGDEEFMTSDLIGAEHGYRFRKVVDRFVTRVLKTEEDMVKRWVDNRLTIACRYGFTLVYDEFTRSRPEANNILLSILQEKMMDLPVARDGEEPYLKVHPDFIAVFTSNPEEYAGVHRSQDALRDRMVTMDLDCFDYETEVAIAQAKSKLPKPHVETIVNIVRGLRESGKCEFAPTVRGSIMIAKTLKVQELTPPKAKNVFMQMCQDILASETSRVGSKTNQDRVRQIVKELVTKELYESKIAHPSSQVNQDDLPRAEARREILQNEESLIKV
ncbi:MAG: gas vesicle protein GvpN [Planctomycetes bacterium RBG_16_55_9]|nr:MAG: gas vesicle protein GvpN [Planctomycetes bacterium RBG_16_55_9]